MPVNMPGNGDWLSRSKFDEYMRDHERDENAHSAERHRQNDDWAGGQLRQDRDIMALMSWMGEHRELHAKERGELAGITNTLRIGFAVLGVMITAFGASVLLLIAR